jgi:hypothetical protein
MLLAVAPRSSRQNQVTAAESEFAWLADHLRTGAALRPYSTVQLWLHRCTARQPSRLLRCHTAMDASTTRLYVPQQAAWPHRAAVLCQLTAPGKVKSCHRVQATAPGLRVGAEHKFAYKLVKVSPCAAGRTDDPRHNSSAAAGYRSD